MTSIDVPRNQNQFAGITLRVTGRVVLSSTGIYTVPAGKRTRVTDIQGNLDAVGSDLTSAVAIFRFSTSTFEAITLFKGVGIDVTASEVTMDEGDILTVIGDSGATNSTYDLSATIKEFSN